MNINATLFVEVLIFLSFVWLTMKYVWPHVNEVIEERQSLIAEGVKNAKESSEKLSSAKVEAKQILEDAKDSNREVMAHTEERLRNILDQAHQQGEQERQRIVERAELDIQQSKKIAYEDLLNKVSSLTMKAAKAVLRDTVDVNIDQKLVDQLIKEQESE